MHDRPLSPHVSVYRIFRYTLLTSFLNRITGVALSAAFLVLVYWLLAISQGAESYARAADVLSGPVFAILFAGWLVSFAYHLVAGIRHLVWDTGRGLEREQAKKSAWVVFLISGVIVLVLGWFIVTRLYSP